MWAFVSWSFRPKFKANSNAFFTSIRFSSAFENVLTKWLLIAIDSETLHFQFGRIKMWKTTQNKEKVETEGETEINVCVDRTAARIDDNANDLMTTNQMKLFWRRFDCFVAAVKIEINGFGKYKQKRPLNDQMHTFQLT